MKKFIKRLFLSIILCLPFVTDAHAQKILNYGPEEPIASIHYNQFLFGIYKNSYKKLPHYPVKGVYSPTHYAITSSHLGAGECNYIYIPTKGALIPGQQYHIRLAIKVGKAYSEMPYFKSHFGIALTSDLFVNHFGLWRQHFVPLDIKTTDEPVLIDVTFRPLCTSNYLVLGVFQGPEMDKQDCFACQYGFELYNLMIEQSEDENADFVYLCDAFEEERMEKLYSTGFDTDTVYFDSGSSEVKEAYYQVLDTIPFKLRTKQDLITLYAYTDKSGSDNDALGEARNMSVQEALILRGVDSRRILMVNYGESRASHDISPQDRRVEIDINRGKLNQKYYTEALQAAQLGDYRLTHEAILQWLKMVPPNNAIYALFDCWGQGEKSNVFLQSLVKNIKSKFYRGKGLKFTLDSLSCEDQKNRTLPMSLSMNQLPGVRLNCIFEVDSLRDKRHQSAVDNIFRQFGFPAVEQVGERGNKTLPYMILHSSDTSFQSRYLPLIKKACEDQIISWENYAMLYDKINIVRNGHQRYGTQWSIDKNGFLSDLFPIEDESRVAEYRRQVGLIQLSDF